MLKLMMDDSYEARILKKDIEALFEKEMVNGCIDIQEHSKV